jgi:hypothetical protein
MAKKDETIDLKKIIADAERYHDAVMENNRIGEWDSPTSRELYDIADELFKLAISTLKDKYSAFVRHGRELGFRQDPEELEGEEIEDEAESA